MKKCSTDPEGKKWHKSNAEAVVCGCLSPKSTIAKVETKIKRVMPAGLRKYLDDKTAGKASQAVEVVEPTAPAESQKPEQEQEQPQIEKKKNWILEICIVIIAILLAAFWIFHYFLMPPKLEEEKKDE